MIQKALLVSLALAMLVPTVEAQPAPDRVYEVDVTLVGCAVCRKQIKQIFMGIDGVKSVEFDLKAKKAIVTMNGDKVLAKSVVDEAFKRSKYIVNGMVEKKATESQPAPKGT